VDAAPVADDLRAFVAAVDAADSGTHESGVADRSVRVTLRPG
jgi:hypothetical protein